MYKIIGLITTFLITSMMPTFAETSITKVISDLGGNKSSVSVSVKSVASGDTVYSLNEKTPMIPASTLKLVTSSASVDLLGMDYLYSTTLYKSTNNDLYLKLSGDPLLTASDLGKLVSSAKDKNIAPKNFYIDDSAFDTVEWGEGWQWDDDLNPLMPKFSIYNLDKNLLKIEISPTVNGRPPSITVKPFYPLTFVNMISTNTSVPTSVTLEKNNDIAPNMLNASGTVAKMYTTVIPVANPKMNFILRLEETLRTKSLEYFGTIKSAKLPEKNVYVVDTVEHGLDSVLSNILKNSDNLMAETLFKTAGEVYSGNIGSRENSLKMLETYLDENNINHEDIKIVDGSGVSKNNLVTADFMSDFLILKSKKDDFDSFKKLLPTPGEGTLKNRMLYFKDNLYAKTGTLSETSAIAGYITSRRGKVYAFDIMIHDAKTSAVDKKNIEEQILRCIYANY
jgi:D-alanyl-D-alanine carboxypeptidase/D-alanyl-D-alanine-endopeptidase (penicillin-binding protein 4)